MAMTPVTGRLDHERPPSDRAARRTLAPIIGVSVGVTALLLIAMTPMAIAQRLEHECPRDQRTPGLKAASWLYDRSSWLPLNWNCTVEHFDGTTAIYRPVPVVWVWALGAVVVAALIVTVSLLVRSRVRRARS